MLKISNNVTIPESEIEWQAIRAGIGQSEGLDRRRLANDLNDL